MRATVAIARLLGVFVVFRYSVLCLFLTRDGGLDFSFELLVDVRIDLCLIVHFDAFFQDERLQCAITVGSPVDVCRVLYQDCEEPTARLVQTRAYVADRVLVVPAKDDVLADRGMFKVVQVDVFYVPRDFVVGRALGRFIFVSSFFYGVGVRARFFYLFLLYVQREECFGRERTSLVRRFLHDEFYWDVIPGVRNHSYFR